MSVRRWLWIGTVALAACSSRPRPKPAAPPPLTTDAYSHYLRGRIAALEGDDKTASREFELAVAAAPDEPAITVALIESLLGARRRDDAERLTTRALQRWPKLPEVQLAAGRVYRKLRRHQLAAAALERARSLAGSDELLEDAVLELAAVHVATEHPERAKSVYRWLIEREPELAAPRYRLLALLVKTRDFAAAVEVGRALVELRPAHVKARVLYSRALAGAGDKDGALATLREAFERSGGQLDVGEQLFDALLDARQRRSALELLEFLAGGDLDGDDRVKVGHLFLRVGHFARAESIAAAVLGDDADNEAAVELRASALAGLGQYERAAEAIEPLTTEIWARGFAAEMLVHAGKPGAAIALLKEAQPQPHREIFRSRISEIDGDLSAARKALDAARQRWPRDRDIVYARASLELRAGEHAVAAELIDSLRLADPDSLQLLNFLGYALADGGIELERSEKLLSRALSRAPDNPGILDSYGWLHFRRGDLGAAAANLYRALRLAPVDPEILFHVGSLENALGRRPAARRRLLRARARSLEPTLRARIDAEMVRSSP